MNAAAAIHTTQASVDPAGVDLVAVKARQQAAWSSGNYAVVGTTLQIVGEELCEALDIRSGQKVLDVAAGNGNATLAAARRWCDVTSTDYVTSLLDVGRRRAEAEGLRVDFRRADAEDLPFDAHSFDVVLSTFGVMFAPDQARAAAELLRVCKPGGRIGLANWTPQGFIGQLFRIVGRHLPPPRGVQPPALWGTEAFLREHFAGSAAIVAERRTFVFRYRSPEHFLDVFRTYYGPVNKVFEALDEPGKKSLRDEMVALIQSLNRNQDGTMAVGGEYLQARIEKK